ncbi:IS1167 transposase [Streptococcus pneumoniae]|nr:IS1167 transposase [Streptococcus pneumoniae]
MDIMEPILCRKKSPIRSIMKSDQTIIRKNHMGQLHFITKLLDIKDPNVQILNIINKDTHKESVDSNAITVQK